MRDDTTTTGPHYEPPSIEERTPVGLPLVGFSGTAPSAAFRTSPRETYESPRIEARDPIGNPLIGGPGTSGPVGT